MISYRFPFQTDLTHSEVAMDFKNKLLYTRVDGNARRAIIPPVINKYLHTWKRSYASDASLFWVYADIDHLSMTQISSTVVTRDANFARTTLDS